MSGVASTDWYYNLFLSYHYQKIIILEHEIRDFASRINLDFTECFQRIQFHASSMNPALGARGCRSAVVWPEIIEMQTRAIMSMLMLVLFL